MVKDNELRTEYIKIYDNIHASDELKDKVLKLKNKKRNPKPFIASAATVAAGIMIFAAVHNVPLDRNKEDDVISETVTTVDGTEPGTENSVMPPFDGGYAADADAEPNEKNAAPAPNADNKPKNTSPADKPAPSVPASASAAVKTDEQLEREAAEQANRTYERAASGVSRKSVSEKAAADNTAEVYTVPETDRAAYQLQTEEVPAQISAEDAPVHAGIVEDNKEITSKSGSTAAMSGMRAKAGGVVFRMNTSAALNMLSYNTAAVSSYRTAAAAVQEEWDNNRYFNYIGKDIISCIESVEGFAYIGDDGTYFMTDENGKPQNDSRMFAFSNGTDRVNIITSTDTTFTDAYMSEEELLKSSVNGTQAVIFELENEYKCYMASEGIAYIIDVYTQELDVLEAVLLSI